MKNVDLNKVYDFLKIVELGNITRAAEVLGYPKARLSRNLALLEQDLGVQLAYRTTRQFQLTAAGQEFYANAKAQVDQLEVSILNLKSQDQSLKGPIRITAPEDVGNYLVTPVLSEFQKAYPQVFFEILYTNDVIDLVKMGVDIAVRLGQLQDSSLKQKKVGRIDMICVASPEYFARRPVPDKVEKLSQHQALIFQSQDSWKLKSAQGQKILKPQSIFRSNNFSAIKDLALRGHGIALMPRFLIASELAQGSLIHLLKGWTDQGVNVQLLCPEQKKTPVRIEKFYDFLGNRLKNKLNQF